MVCLWAEPDSKRRLRQLAHPGSYHLLGESSQECIFAEDAAGARPGASGWWTLGPTCKRCSRPLALESDSVISGSSTPPLRGPKFCGSLVQGKGVTAEQASLCSADIGACGAEGVYLFQCWALRGVPRHRGIRLSAKMFGGIPCWRAFG